MNKNSLVDKYRSKGYKITPQRLAILSSLQDDYSHPAVMDIYYKVKKDFPSLSLTTVYNTLDILEKMDIVRGILIDDRQKRYETQTQNNSHDHIICIECHKVENLQNTCPIQTTSKLQGYTLLTTRAQYIGVCAECSKKNV